MQRLCRSVATSTSSASTVDTLDDLILLELLARHATDASAVEVGFLGLDASETAELAEQSVSEIQRGLQGGSIPFRSPASSTLRSSSCRRSCSSAAIRRAVSRWLLSRSRGRRCI